MRATQSFAILLFAAILTLPTVCGAQPANPPSAAAPAMTDGEIRKIDKSAGKMTIKHGEIKSLDMPPMTMVFRIKDTDWLDQFKAGDKVRFAAAKEKGGYVVTHIEPQK